MTQRNKLILPVNKSTTIKLLFNDCIEGSNQFGKFYMYAVEVDGEEYTFFPPAEVHDQLKLMHKGEKAVITKLAVQRGCKVATAFEVRPRIEWPSPLLQP